MEYKNHAVRDSDDADDEDTVYNKQIRMLLVENDEIRAWEEGFMQGYDEAG